MKRTRKTSEPSLRDRLTLQFIEVLEKDWAAHGTNIIEKMRLESPTKYAEIVSRLVVPTEQPPAPDDFRNCQSQADIAIKMLKDIGTPEASITLDMIEAAIRAQQLFVAELERIAATSAARELH